MAIGILLIKLLLEPFTNYLFNDNYNYFEAVERSAIRIMGYEFHQIVIRIFLSIVGGIGFTIILERRKRRKNKGEST